MIGMGTVINVALIVFGTFLGLVLKNGISERFKNTVTRGIGLAVCFIGISGVVSKMLVLKNNSFETQYTMLMVLSLVIGGFFGELINIEKHLERFGDFCKTHIKFKHLSENFTEGFVSASLLFCVGAMAIVGSLEDGLTGDFSTLFAKGVMDGTMSVFFAASMGLGVLLSIVPVIVYQGGITVLAGVIGPYLSTALIEQLSLVGSVLIFAIGINMLVGTKIKVGNLLPAVLIPVFYNLILYIL